MEILNVIHTDKHVTSLQKPSIEMINTVFDFFPLKATAYLYETSHGHIIQFEFKEENFRKGDEEKALRLNSKELIFLSSLIGFRWVEAKVGSLHIGFKNTPE